MITIVIMGILAAIAIPAWNGIMRQRQVDSATGQLVGDLRLASTKAANQLTPWAVSLTSGSPSYQMEASGSTNPPITHRLDGAEVTTTGTITFQPDGSLSSGSPTSIGVAASGGSPSQTIHIDPATSEVKAGG